MDLVQNRHGAAQGFWPLDRGSIWKPLDKEKREIRIILLQPSDEEDDALYADLEIVSLYSKPEYKAISYVWGDPSDTTDMFLNGGKVKITKSLGAALRRFRDSSDLVALWADAVCINQEDFQERSNQVRIMGEIYAAAVQVNVWLGRLSDRGWHDALYSFLEAQDLPRTDEVFEQRESFFEYLFSQVVENINIGTHPLGLDQWSAWLQQLSCSPWFLRRWIVQEVALARFTIFFSGKHSCTQDALCSILDHIPGLTLRHPQYLTLLFTAYTPIFAALQAKRRANTADFCELMMGFHHLDCQNDLDRVYSLLGLSTTVSDFPIDYQRTVEEVYVDLATKCIAEEGPEGIFISSTCGEKSSKLPSWVPDWRGGFVPYQIVSFKQAKLHAACSLPFRGVNFKSYLEDDRGKLRISALIIDRLDTLFTTFSDFENLEACKEGKEVKGLRLKISQQWQGFFQNVKEFLLQVVCCNAGWERISRSRKITPANLGKVEGLEKAIADAVRHKNDLPSASDTVTLESCRARTQLFLTTSGRLGHASVGVEEGDLVAVFPSCKIPFIIRSAEYMAEHRSFKLISPCYVHGIMAGEALLAGVIVKAKAEESKSLAEAVASDFNSLLLELADKYSLDLFEEIVLV